MPKGQAYDVVPLVKVSESFTGAAHKNVATPATGKQFRVNGVYVWSTAESEVNFREETATATTGFLFVKLAAKTGIYVPIPGSGYLAGLNAKLDILSETTGVLVVTIFGTEDVA